MSRDIQQEISKLNQKRQIKGAWENLRIPPSPPPACGAHCIESPSCDNSPFGLAPNPSLFSLSSLPSRDISGTWPIPDLRTKWARRGVFPPAGYVMLPDWARACGHSPNTARVHLRKGHLPEVVRVGRTRRYNAVPESLPWPAKANGRPRKAA